MLARTLLSPRPSRRLSLSIIRHESGLHKSIFLRRNAGQSARDFPDTRASGLLAFRHAYTHVDRPRAAPHDRPQNRTDCSPAQLPDSTPAGESPTHLITVGPRVTYAHTPRARINARKERTGENEGGREKERRPSRPNEGKVSSRTPAGDINCTNYGRLTRASKSRLVPASKGNTNRRTDERDER